MQWNINLQDTQEIEHYKDGWTKFRLWETTEQKLSFFNRSIASEVGEGDGGRNVYVILGGGGLHHVPCEISVPWSGIEPAASAVEACLTTVLPGKSQEICIWKET